MNKSVLNEVYRYWFGDDVGHSTYPKGKAEIWFKQSDETDKYIKQTFGAAITEAAKTEWDLATLTRQELVGLIVLLDQFPRNIFRDSSEAFAYDDKAHSIARQVLDGDWDFTPAERCFVMLPLEHSEDIADQDLCVSLFAERAVAAPEALKEICRYELDFATKHRDIIREFGRFPHRNTVLGRKSTPEEETFLAEKGRGF